jgi:hypothetical protein
VEDLLGPQLINSASIFATNPGVSWLGWPGAAA